MSEYIYEITKDADGVDCYIKRGEVVRCKDCMYNDRGWCGSQEYGTRHVEDNDYCSYGEDQEHE